MTRALTALVALTLLVLPCAASAQTNAPPGNSAIDEYLETVPGATGNQTAAKPGTAGATLTAAERARLGGMGVLLPAILIATLLGVIALLLARRRSAGR